jgi:hypothetical protein
MLDSMLDLLLAVIAIVFATTLYSDASLHVRTPVVLRHPVRASRDIRSIDRS